MAKQPVLGEEALVAALRDRDEGAFVALVDAYGPSMRRLALTFVRSQEIADEVVQEAWLGALRGLERFEARSSLKTWLFRIVANKARSRAVREARTIPLSPFDFEAEARQASEPAVPVARFQGADGMYPGGWITFPPSWSDQPEIALVVRETRELIARVIETLPPGQRVVITLRDVEGWSAEEVCSVLALTETNQRVLLHRARSKVRAALEDYVTKEAE